MSEHGMHEAKTHLSKLVERALAGEDVVLTRRGEPAVKLVPVEKKTGWAAIRGMAERKHVSDDELFGPSWTAEEEAKWDARFDRIHEHGYDYDQSDTSGDSE